MALKNCKECGKEVSSSAKKCPHCGVKNPGGWFSYTGVGGEGLLKGCGCIVLILLAGWLLVVCAGGLATV